MLFDQEHRERQQAIDNAFATGEQRGYQRGREECDEHVMAECVALRVQLAKREHLEVVSLNVCACVSFLGAWCFLAWLVLA